VVAETNDKPKPIKRKNTRSDLKAFTILRNNDASGVSGIGRVADGVIFSDGFCVIRWRSEVTSLSVFHSFEDFEKIHVKSHPENMTEIVWVEQVGLNSAVVEYKKHKKQIKEQLKKEENESKSDS